jgi:hypothetical protein
MPVYPGAPESAPEPLNLKNDTPIAPARMVLGRIAIVGEEDWRSIAEINSSVQLARVACE